MVEKTNRKCKTSGCGHPESEHLDNPGKKINGVCVVNGCDCGQSEY